jgi:UDP-galactopyranose mutase
LVQDKLTPIPFNFTSIDKYFPKTKEEIKNKLTKKYGENTRVSILDLMKSNDSQIQDVANFIYENIFKNYTIKM